MWLVRLSTCTLALALLGGCGFTPIYAQHGGQVATNLPQVKVKQIPDKLGVVLTNKLRDSFNPQSMDVPARYQLVVNLNKTDNSFATRPDGTAAWTDVQLKADWHLERIADGKPITAGSASALAGYALANDNFANVTSESADELRDVDQIAMQIQDQVAIYFKTGAATAIAEGAQPPQEPTAAIIQP